MSVVWTKAALINRIAGGRGYRSYLEICSPTAGNRYGEIDRSVLTISRRLMYGIPQGYSDGMRIDFATSGLDTSEWIRQIRTRQLRFDIILVDALHEYDPTMRDLRDALSLLESRGTIVVHDCLPPREELAGPVFRVGEWCGLTYKAYLDFVTARPELEYRTVNIDYGCGVIRAAPPGDRSRASDASEALIARWNALGDDIRAAYRFMQEHRATLCRLQSIEEFIRDEEGSAESEPQLQRAQE